MTFVITGSGPDQFVVHNDDAYLYIKRNGLGFIVAVEDEHLPQKEIACIHFDNVNQFQQFIDKCQTMLTGNKEVLPN